MEVYCMTFENKFLVSKETLMVRQWEGEIWYSYNELRKVELSPWKIWKAEISSVSSWSEQSTLVSLKTFV